MSFASPSVTYKSTEDSWCTLSWRSFNGSSFVACPCRPRKKRRRLVHAPSHEVQGHTHRVDLEFSVPDKESLPEDPSSIRGSETRWSAQGLLCQPTSVLLQHQYFLLCLVHPLLHSASIALDPCSSRSFFFCELDTQMPPLPPAAVEIQGSSRSSIDKLVPHLLACGSCQRCQLNSAGMSRTPPPWTDVCDCASFPGLG